MDSSQTPPPTERVDIFDVPVNNQIVAFQVIVKFLEEANKRGAFTFKESAKIWQCLELFKPPPSSSENEIGSTLDTSTKLQVT